MKKGSKHSQETKLKMVNSASKRIMPKQTEEHKEKIRQSNLKTWSDPILLEQQSKKTKLGISKMSIEKRKKWLENNIRASRTEKNRERARKHLLKMRENEDFLKKQREGKSKAFIGSGNPFFGKKHTIETRLKVSKTKKESDKTRRGKDNPAFIDGKGNQRKQERISFQETIEYRIFRENVFKRDNFKCVKCGSKRQLECHHIKSYKGHPALRTDENNAITLCKNCHKRTDNYGRKKLQEKK
jgi:hypothetical protein